jgi:hypothetical protein
MSVTEKRPAVSPLVDERTEDKRFRASDPFDPDPTIITGDLLSSTMADDNESPTTKLCMVAALKEALSDPDVVSAIVGAVTDQLKREIVDLRKQLVQRDLRIQALEDKVDEQEQYQRRNNVRISEIPEAVGEDTDVLVVKLAETLGVTLDEDDIDRSHRVGRPPDGDNDGRPRALLVKFVSYKSKRALITSRKGLKSLKGGAIFPSLKWKVGQEKSLLTKISLQSDPKWRKKREIERREVT